MNPSTGTLSPQLLVILAVITPTVGLGGWLLLTARQPEDADGPRCFNCGYNLTGLVHPRCPECGLEITPETRALAPPSTLRWGRFLAGAALVGAPLSWVLYHYILQG
jgi:hypothetical protein